VRAATPSSFVRLTPLLVQSDTFVAMSVRGLLCLTLIAFIALVSVCPLPVGHGPRTAVYGPATAFRAYRASLQLRSAVSALLVVLMAFASLCFPRSEHSEFDAVRDAASVPPLPLLTTLRC